MTLNQMEQAAYADFGPWGLTWRDRILVMLAVIRAADAMRKDSPHISDRLLRSYDAARVQLEEL